MKRIFAFALFGLVLTAASPGRAVEIQKWERLPLAVPLVVGQERVVFIDRNVRVGIPASLSEQLRVQSAGGAVYLLASEPIAPSRLQLQDMTSGEIILLDVAAEPAKAGQPALEPVRIVRGDVPTPQYGDTSLSENTQKSQPSDTQQRETPLPVVLTRYAAQNLYAPLRTVEPLPGITRANLRRDLALASLLPTLPVRARALTAWRLEDHWVTAVRLTNTTAGWINLDPRALQGDFVAATFQHSNLGPAGTSTDTSVVYLVTRGRSLDASLLPAVSAIDATVNLSASEAAGQLAGGTPDEK